MCMDVDVHDEFVELDSFRIPYKKCGTNSCIDFILTQFIGRSISEISILRSFLDIHDHILLCLLVSKRKRNLTKFDSDTRSLDFTAELLLLLGPKQLHAIPVLNVRQSKSTST